MTQKKEKELITMDFTSTKEVLTRSRLEELAPSVFTTEKKNSLTDRYNFVPTYEVMKTMENQGWLPVHAREQKVRTPERESYQKHMLRFRCFDEKPNQELQVGDSIIEAVLTNSHDGFASFVFKLGVFRLACKNGMVVPEGMFQSIRIRHNSYDATRVIETCTQIINDVPRVRNSMDEMRKIILTPDEQLAFAEVATQLRFESPSKVYSLEDVIRPRRIEDKGDDLWKTFGRVQENLTKGGVRMKSRNNQGRTTLRKSKELKAIDSNIKLNQALWALAEKMKKLKQQ